MRQAAAQYIKYHILRFEFGEEKEISIQVTPTHTACAYSSTDKVIILFIYLFSKIIRQE